MYKIIGADKAEYGPVSAAQLQQWIAEGRINAQTLAQAEGETNWKPIAEFPDFAALFPTASAASPPPPPPGPPPLGTTAPNPAGRSLAMQEATGPAIGLMVTGALGIAYALMNILGSITGVSMNNFMRQMQNGNFPAQNAQMLHVMQMSTGAVGVIFGLLHLGLGIMLIYGGMKMKQLENHSFCIVASIVAIIPCFSPCCCVGLPIGIWALVILNKPDVRNYFS